MRNKFTEHQILLVLTWFICSKFVNGQFTDENGRFVFDAPPSIINRNNFESRPIRQNFNRPNQQNFRFPNNFNQPSGINQPNFNRPSFNRPGFNQNQFQQGFPNQNNLDNNFLPPTPAPPVAGQTPAANTPRPQLAATVLRCLRLCPTTNEYNPVCGSDNITYSNPQKLACAQTCGQSVQAVRQGRCRAFAPIQN